VTRSAAEQIRMAATWWHANRPQAPDAMAQEVARAFELIALQPRIGVEAASPKLAGCVASGLPESGTTSTTESTTPRKPSTSLPSGTLAEAQIQTSADRPRLAAVCGPAELSLSADRSKPRPLMAAVDERDMEPLAGKKTKRKRTDENGRAYAGSQRHIQAHVAGDAVALNAAVATELANTGARVESIRWLAPLPPKRFAELRDGKFLDAIGCSPRRAALAEFWPPRGPVWDALAAAEPGPMVLLVEAKSYPQEMFGSGCQATGSALALIKDSLELTKAWSGASEAADWLGPLYQYANRLAHVYFLREVCGVQAWLVNVCFVDDPHRSTDIRTWQMHLRTLPQQLGFSAKRAPFTIDVLLPAWVEAERAIPV
jgi:hypothetical protein